MAATNWNYVGTPYSGIVKVRALIGDTDPDDPIVNDYEINAMLAVFSNESEAAAHICRNLAGKFAIEGNVTYGKYKFENLEKAKFYKQRSEDLFVEVYGSKHPMTYAAPSYGGVSITSKETNETNTDIVQPKFFKDQFQNPYTELDDDIE